MLEDLSKFQQALSRGFTTADGRLSLPCSYLADLSLRALPPVCRRLEDCISPGRQSRRCYTTPGRDPSRPWRGVRPPAFSTPAQDTNRSRISSFDCDRWICCRLRRQRHSMGSRSPSLGSWGAGSTTLSSCFTSRRRHRYQRSAGDADPPRAGAQFRPTRHHS